MVACAEQRGSRNLTVDGEIPIDEIRHAASRRIVVEGTLILQVRREHCGILNRRPQCRNLRRKGREPISDEIRDAVRERVAYGSKRAPESLDSVIRVAILAC